MNILLNVRSNKDKGFENFNFVLNKTADLPNGKTEISRFTGNGYQTQVAGTGDLRVSGKVMYVKVRLADLGLSSTDRYISLKVSDNITVQDDIMDYYISGDSAPIGRLAYSYGY